jgi:hypothetical protein
MHRKPSYKRAIKDCKIHQLQCIYGIDNVIPRLFRSPKIINADANEYGVEQASDFTCWKCEGAELGICEWAFDLYNINDYCLAEK